MAISLSGAAPRGSFSFARSGFQIPKAKAPVIKPATPTAAQLAKLNPSGTATWGWTPAQGQSYANSIGYQGPGRIGGDWGGMIGGDYGVQEMESMMNAKRGRAEGDFRTQLRQALVDLGVTDIGKLGNLGQYIDQDTISKAAANKYSQMAQIAQQETSKQAQSQADLAARGMLSSGQLTKNSEDILASGEQARYGATRDFLSAGGKGLSDLADLNDNLAMQLAQARFDAAARAAQTYPYMSDAGYYGATDPNSYNNVNWGSLYPSTPAALKAPAVPKPVAKPAVRWSTPAWTWQRGGW